MALHDDANRRVILAPAVMTYLYRKFLVGDRLVVTTRVQRRFHRGFVFRWIGRGTDFTGRTIHCYHDNGGYDALCLCEDELKALFGTTRVPKTLVVAHQ